MPHPVTPAFDIPVQYASDLHLEFNENRKFIQSQPLVSRGGILVLAGDIMPLAVIDKHQDFLNYLADHFEETFWVPGNHEYYHFDMGEKDHAFQESVRPNVHLVNNVALDRYNRHYIFSTMWSRIPVMSEKEIEMSVNDFYQIRYNGQRLTASVFNRLHEQSLAFLEKELDRDTPLQTIVVTHHVPTYLNYPPAYKAGTITAAFAVELFGMIEKNGPDYWIYGHHHTNGPDFTIGKTKMLTNQLGYVKYGENKLFDSGKVIAFEG